MVVIDERGIGYVVVFCLSYKYFQKFHLVFMYNMARIIILRKQIENRFERNKYLNINNKSSLYNIVLY